MENKFMKIALLEAQKAIEAGEMPVGAVVVKNGEVIATGHNVRNELHDPTLHAEIVAIRKACEILKMGAGVQWDRELIRQFIIIAPSLATNI